MALTYPTRRPPTRSKDWITEYRLAVDHVQLTFWHIHARRAPSAADRLPSHHAPVVTRDHLATAFGRPARNGDRSPPVTAETGALRRVGGHHDHATIGASERQRGLQADDAGPQAGDLRL